MPGTRWARSTSRISCSMSRSSLMPASSRPIAVLMPACLEVVERGDARAQAEIRRAVVAHAGPGRRHAVDVLLVEPHAVAERHARAEHVEAVDVLDRGAARRAARRIPSGRRSRAGACASARCISSRLRRARSSALSEHQCRLAGASWIFTRRLLLWRLEEAAEQPHALVEAGLEAREPALHRLLQLLGQARDELLDRPGRRAGSGRAPRSSRTRACRCPRRRGSPRSHLRLAPRSSVPGIQPWMCCTVVMPEAIISNAE